MTTVGPIQQTQVSLVYDSDAQGLAGVPDMTGPVVGAVAYAQDPIGALTISVDLEFGHPNVVYDIILTSGPSHDLAAGWAQVGQLKTDPAGRGSVGVTVPTALLSQPPFGTGYRTDHLDLLQLGQPFTAGVLAAGAINYFSCSRAAGYSEERSETAAAELFSRGDTDPIAVERES